MNEIFFGSVLLIVLVMVLTVLVVAARSVLMPSRPVVVTVNSGTQIKAHTGEKLLAALNDNGVLVPSACAGAGTCGLCRVQLEGGDVPLLPTESARLSQAEQRDGVHLACQVVLREDMNVHVDEDLLGAESFNCVVESARMLTPLIRELVLKVPDGQAFDLVAGGFVQVTAPAFSLAYRDIDVPSEFASVWGAYRGLSVDAGSSVTRAYSVSNRPEDTAAGRIVLNIRLALPPPSVPDAQPGVVSSWLFGVSTGETVEVTGPFGTFRAQNSDREMVLIGGGVGMAPLRAIIHDQLGRGASRPVSFWYGARSGAELFYHDEFDTLAKSHKNFQWTVALSDPSPEDKWEGATGFIHRVAFETYLRDHPAPEDCEYYLCGPPLMIKAVLAMLDDAGVDSSSIFTDDFGV